MDPVLRAVLISAGLFIGTMVFLEVGYRAAFARSKPGGSQDGIRSLEAAIFGLLGLLLGFSFSGGTSRLDFRRHLIVEEANAIGTAYLRLDLLPAQDQPKLRQLFRDYLDARLQAYDKLPDMAAAHRGFEHAQKFQHEIWSSAVNASRVDPTGNTSRVLLPALNEMIDVTTERTVALNTHLPGLIFALLVFLTLLSGLLAGYAMGGGQKRSWLHSVIYAIAVSVTVYAVADLDNPRAGLIQLNSAEKALLDLRHSIR